MSRGGITMFQIYNPDKQIVPIKVWLENESQIDSVCMTQALNLSNIPFAHKWIALMPDTHQGFGMPIGGVLALKDHLIPNAVGVDIGCGMIYLETNFYTGDLTPAQKNIIIKKVLARIPVGFKHRELKLEDAEFKAFLDQSTFNYKGVYHLYEEIEASYYQIGTLGGGNHFIELQVDEQGMLSIMVHSGSRNFGYKIANYFNDKAEQYSKKHDGNNLAKRQLAYLPAESDSGKSYLEWMNLALTFAQRNRQVMLDLIKEILIEELKDIDFLTEINAHHNYAAFEKHYGESVWVHRKGAIRALKGELGIIPGAMGSFSYIVRGLGNPESFCSSSHGAGRHYSRKQAEKLFGKEMVLNDLEKQGVILGIPDKSVLVDESRFVYKDINQVINQQKDLCEPVKELKTLMVVKG